MESLLSRLCRSCFTAAASRPIFSRSLSCWRATLAAGLALTSRRFSQSIACALLSSVRCPWRAILVAIVLMARSQSLRSGTTSSAAPDGVGARMSATKSAIVKSTS